MNHTIVALNPARLTELNVALLLDPKKRLPEMVTSVPYWPLCGVTSEMALGVSNDHPCAAVTNDPVSDVTTRSPWSAEAETGARSTTAVALDDRITAVV